MKRLLLSCFLALGGMASAQFNLQQGFNSTTGVAGFGSGSLAVNSTIFCAAAPSISQTNANAATGSGGVLQQMKPLNQFSNGEQISLDMSFRKGGTGVGTVRLYYAIQNNDQTWSRTFVGDPVAITAASVTSCMKVSAIIPAGAIPEDPKGDSNIGFGLYYTRVSGAATIYYDDLVVKQKVNVLPNCTTFVSPTNGSVISAGAGRLTWNTADNATGYKVTLGTTEGGSDVYSNTVTATFLEVPLVSSTTYFANIVPTNEIGDAQGCTAAISFTTNSTLAYCAAVPKNDGFNDGITNVVLNGETTNIANATSSSAGSEYTDYTATIGADVARGSSYELSVYVNTDGDYTQHQVAWIDWNQNGAFESNERYDLGTATDVSNGLSSLCPLNIVVPSDAVVGNTRMRVRTFYNIANTTNPCVSGDDGEVEDYKITVLGSLASSDVAKANVAVYPNPFSDLLNISDVKGVKSVSITDLAGRQVKSMKASAQLNVSDLKTGLYIVTLHMEDGSVKSHKAIKK